MPSTAPGVADPATGASAMDLCGIVLAGGRSRRMGRDKAWLELDGEPLVVRVLAQLAPHVGALYLSVGAARDPRFATLGRPLLHDTLPAAGPLAGLVSALTALGTAHARALVLSCDTPELPAPLIMRLLDALDDANIDASAIEDHEQRLQPLCACYRLDVAARLAAAVASGERRMRAVETLLRLQRVPLLPGEQLQDLDTPEALAAYLARAR